MQKTTLTMQHTLKKSQKIKFAKRNGCYVFSLYESILGAIILCLNESIIHFVMLLKMFVFFGMFFHVTCLFTM